MVPKAVLRQVLLQQKEDFFKEKKTILRELLSHLPDWFKDNRIIILTGIRRCGKSTLLKQIMHEKKSFCYVNFEHERFLTFTAEDFELLHEALIEIYGPCQLYFFDEIQNIPRFEAFVRRLQDQGKKIFITGSNASLLSKELGTKLTGRYKAVEVFPFSFREFLWFHQKKPDNNWFYVTEKKAELIKQFTAFLAKGGFPEYLLNNDPDYLKTTYENIIYRDIISRYGIKKQRLLRELVSLLIPSVSSLITYNALKTTLGLANAITIKEYLSYLTNTYLFFEVQRFDFSLKKQLAAPKKVYAIDQGMYQATGFSLSENKGRILENIAFLELKRRGKEIYYYMSQRECDFVIKKGIKIVEAIQICYELHNNNRERELKGLKETMDTFQLKKGLLLTYDQEEEIKLQKKIVYIMPVWKWLLE